MRPEPGTYHLARIEPREELAVHLLPLEGLTWPLWGEHLGREQGGAGRRFIALHD